MRSSATKKTSLLFVCSVQVIVLVWCMIKMGKAEPPIPFLWDKFTLHVGNNISVGSGTLYVHCKSKDDDLGEQKLGYGQEVHWKFGVAIVGKSTHFVCQVRWGDKSRSFDAFVDGAETNACLSTKQVYWKAALDAIYFACHDGLGAKRCDWDPNLPCKPPY